ncbi:hypothetical protein BH11CYA1_BH11CYA1_17590 [soil metagenome]
MNPFEIHGPAYLIVYFAICGTVFLAATKIRNWMLLEEAKKCDRSGLLDPAMAARQLEPYEAAFLAGGSERVFLTACGSLARHKLIDIDKTTGRVTITGRSVSDVYGSLDRVEKALLNSVRGTGESLTACNSIVLRATSDITRKLVASGLIVDSSRSQAAHILPGFIYWLVALVFAVPRFIEASAAHRPVGFLVVEMMIALAIGLILFKNEKFKTAKGHAVLKVLGQSNSALRLTHATNPASLSLRDCALAYGLFGGIALAGDPFLAAHSGLHRAYASSSSDSGGSSCGSSCGGGCGGGCGG